MTIYAMNNPWLQIPLADYEAHMTLPHVGQAQLLGDVFDDLLRQQKPQSVAVLGCAGGNGFERISSEMTGRVVGIDVNPKYIEQVHARFHQQFPILELFAQDIASEHIDFLPVDLLFAGLFFEYVDLDLTLKRCHTWLRTGGILGSVLQLPQPEMAAVTPSPFASLQLLTGALHLISPVEFCTRAQAHAFQPLDSRQLSSPGGKRFQLLTFERTPLT